jgi:hypothetical protein
LIDKNDILVYNIIVNNKYKIMKKILTFALLVFPAIASAQSAGDFGVNNLSSANLGSQELQTTIAGVINIILGFLGILTTLAILWGGFNMMTSYGSAEKSEKGKDAVTAGAIGLIIVLTAYAISQFVLRSLVNETIA